MKKQLLKLLSLTMALLISMSFVAVQGANVPFEPGTIDLSVVATKNDDGNYAVKYTAITTMVEKLAKAAAIYRADHRMSELRFVCALTDPLVGMLEFVSKTDFTFESIKWRNYDVFIFEEAEVENDTLTITYRINENVLDAWASALTEDVKTSLTEPMTMVAEKVVDAATFEKAGDGFKTTATLKIEGEGVERYFGYNDILAAKGETTVSDGSEPGTDEPTVGVEDCTGGENCPAGYLVDIDTKLWYHDGVHYCVENKLMKGMTDTEFGPELSITRAMIATILYRIAGSPEVDGTQVFDDVIPTAWYGAAIEWASENNVVTGYGNGNFGPDDAITREQMAAMLYRYAATKGYDVTVPEDAEIKDYADTDKVSEYAKAAMEWACHNGIITGYEDSTLRPAGFTRRCEAAVMLYRYCTIIAK